MPNRSGSGPAPARVVAVPRSIDPTGRADVTRALLRFIAGVPNDTTVRFAPNGRYRIEGTLDLKNRRDLTFDGAGATLFATARGAKDRSQWWIHDGARITFRDMNVRGANLKGGTGKAAYVKKLETQHGIRLEGVDGAEVDRVTVTNVYGDFVYVGRDGAGRPSRNVWIHDSTFRSNGRQGVAVTAATGVVVEHNSFANLRRSTIDLEPTGHRWLVDGVFVLNNMVGSGRLLFVASHGQGEVNDVVISGNQLRGHPLSIDVVSSPNRRRKNWIVAGNTSTVTTRSRPLRFSGIDGLVLRDNHQIVAGGAQGLVLSDVCGAEVSGNELGRGVVHTSGAPCAAKVTTPVPPVFAGRKAGTGLGSGLGRGGTDHTLLWVLVAIGAALALLVVTFAVRRRRRRRRAPVTPS